MIKATIGLVVPGHALQVSRFGGLGAPRVMTMQTPEGTQGRKRPIPHEPSKTHLETPKIKQDPEGESISPALKLNLSQDI